jgi:hypothetical protein
MEDKVTKPSEPWPSLPIRIDVKPTFVNYRNPQDDKIGLAIEEAVKRLLAKGKPLMND